ncbi:MAG: amine oxidase [Actinomycetota bacterium]
MVNTPSIGIVGAGLAGLSAARTLESAGFAVTIFEAKNQVGGRVSSRNIDGFILDEGFQVFNPAYPTARSLLNYEKLDLRAFSAGVKIALDEKDFILANPLRDPKMLLKMVRGFQFPADFIRFALYALRCLQTQGDHDEISAVDALRNLGLSEDFIWKVLNPFLQGVFLDSKLTASKSFLDFVLKYFVIGRPTVPYGGMHQIPMQLASSLQHTTIHLETPILGIDKTSLITAYGRSDFDAVVIATDSGFVNEHFGIPTPDFHEVTTWYHSASWLSENRIPALLHVDSDPSRGPLINSVVLSDVSSGYAPKGQHLISSSTLTSDSSPATEQKIREHLAVLHQTNTDTWQVVEVIHVKNALNQAVTRDIDTEILDNVYVAGDWTTSTSIEGAMASGVKVAQRIQHKLGK